MCRLSYNFFMRSLFITLLFISLAFSNEKTVTFITDPADPFIIGKEGEVPKSGIVLDVIHKVFEDIDGYEAEHAPITAWQRSLKLVENGEIDAISVILKNPQREKKYLYSDKVISAKTVFFYKKDTKKAKNWSNIKDFENFTICTVKGYNVEHYLNTLKKEKNIDIKLYTVNKFGKCFDLLLKNRIDVYVENYHTGSAFLKKQPYAEKFLVMEKPVYEKHYYFAFSKNSEAHKLIPQINDSLKKLQETGRVKEIEKKYLSN